jgi:hypothetical protein
MKHTSFLAALLLALSVPTVLAAQQQQTALLATSDSWGRMTLLNEATGENLGSVGLVRGNLNGVTSAEAARQFRSAQRHRTIGTAMIGVGSAIAVGALVHYVAQPNGFGMSAGHAAAYGGGAGITILGAQRAWRSQRSLQLAIDSYNGSLALCKAVDGPAGTC